MELVQLLSSLQYSSETSLLFVVHVAFQQGVSSTLPIKSQPYRSTRESCTVLALRLPLARSSRSFSFLIAQPDPGLHLALTLYNYDRTSTLLRPSLQRGPARKRGRQEESGVSAQAGDGPSNRAASCRLCTARSHPRTERPQAGWLLGLGRRSTTPREDDKCRHHRVLASRL